MHLQFQAAQPAERSAGSTSHVQRRQVHSPPAFFFLYFFFSYSSMFFPAGGHACGQAMPHCQELALAQVWGLIHHRLRMSPQHLMRAVSRPISLLNQHPLSRHFPRSHLPSLNPSNPFCELPLQCKVTDAFPHAMKKERVKNQASAEWTRVLHLLKSLKVNCLARRSSAASLCSATGSF